MSYALTFEKKEGDEFQPCQTVEAIILDEEGEKNVQVSVEGELNARPGRVRSGEAPRGETRIHIVGQTDGLWIGAEPEEGICEVTTNGEFHIDLEFSSIQGVGKAQSILELCQMLEDQEVVDVQHQSSNSGGDGVS